MGRKKKEIKLKEPVRIREKRLSDGNISLYLDMYHKGARKKEGLKLYLVPETTSAARMQNSNTRKLAEQINAQSILDIQKHGLVDCEGIKRSHITLSEWVDKYTAEECGLSKESMRSKRNAQARVEQYLIYIGRHDLALRDVDKDFCKGYIAFLKTCTFNNGKKTLSNTTCRIFVNRLTAALTKAVSEGLIDRNPFKLLWTMSPAYFTALGCCSSAATIPVTLKQTLQNGVNADVAGFVVPLCATIHMSGSIAKITGTAIAIMLMQGVPFDAWQIVGFVLMLAITMVAAPGVPGGCVMASLGLLGSMLGFTGEQQALMIAIYIAIDSFGTACNVTGDGAIALIINKIQIKTALRAARPSID